MIHCSTKLLDLLCQLVSQMLSARPLDHLNTRIHNYFSCELINVSVIVQKWWRSSQTEDLLRKNLSGTVLTTSTSRAVRVIDLISNLDMASFQSHVGLNISIHRYPVRPRQSWRAVLCSGSCGSLLCCPPPHNLEEGGRGERSAFIMAEGTGEHQVWFSDYREFSV